MEEVKPHFNLGRKHPNRKKYFKGISIRTKFCLQCNTEYTPQYQNYQRAKFCSRSCKSKMPRPGAVGRVCSPKIIDKNKQRTGEKHPRWIKDRTKVKLEVDRGGPLHKQWSVGVKKRDNWKCRINNQECNGRMESHHILSWKDYPELRYDLNNGITLCHHHHPRKKEDEVKMIPTFKELLTII